MELTFLGTSAGIPTRRRNVSALAVRRGGTWDLFDCGEGTQHQLLRTPLSLSKLRRVFVSHLHGDHCFGLFGLLASRSTDSTVGPLTVFGPRGLGHMIDVVLRTSASHLTYELEVVEVDDEGGPLAVDDLEVRAIPLSHRVTSFAWSMIEPDRPGSFDVETARSLGVPDGPLFGRLQRGESVTLDDGSVVEPAAVVGPVRPGRHVVVAGDGRDPATMLDRSGGADVVVHEATFTEDVLERLGDDRGHSTAARIADAAERHGVGTLVLTHFSARYSGSATPPPPDTTAGRPTASPPPDTAPGTSVDELADEARRHFTGRLHLADDFDRLTFGPDGALDTVERTDA